MADDPIVGTSGSDTLVGDEGDDLIIGDSGQPSNASPAVDAAAANPVVVDPIALSLDALAADVSNVLAATDGGQQTIAAAAAALPSLDALIVPPAPIPQGDAGNNTLIGTNGAETIRGGAGNDTIDGGLGNDVMRGGLGNDQLIWNPRGGNDRIDGGAGIDESLVNGGADNETFDIQLTPDGAQFERFGEKPFTVDMTGTENVTLNALDGNDRFNVAALNGSGVTNVRFNAGAGNDVLDGSASDVALTANGGRGNDRLQGGSANDTLRGGAGNDTFNGGAGDDTIRMGAGRDTVQFATGDVFDPQAIGQDQIRDFKEGDKIALSKETFKALTSEAGQGFSSQSDFAIVGDRSQVDSSEALIVYDKGSGGLFYNSNRTGDGLGRGGDEAFAVFDGKPDIQSDDFTVQA